MPTTNPIQDHSQAPRKRTLSMKAATNGDPNAERKRQKVEATQKKEKTARTKKKPTTTAPNKITTTKKAAAVAKTAPPRSSVDIEEVNNKADTVTSNGGDDDSDMYTDPNPDSEIPVITIDDDEDIMVPQVEEPEESAEAELSTWHFFPLIY
jgi:hypothetical protein